MFKKYSEQIQRFGRSLLLPISVMAPVGMVLGISGAFVQSYMIARFPFLSAPIINTTLLGLRTIAGSIFNNIPLLFAMGVAYGMSKKDKGIAAFSAVIGYIVLLMTMNVYLNTTKTLAEAALVSQSGQIVVLGIQTVNVNVFGGIIDGLVAALSNVKFFNLEFPILLALFGGKKSVAIITMGIMILIGIALPTFWQMFVSALSSLSFILLDKVFGPFIVMAVNRMLIPFGLHHVWNAMIRYTEIGGSYIINGTTYTGVISAMNEILFNQGPSSEFWKMMPSLTRFEAQNQMIITLFAFPAIGLALYKTAYVQNKKLVKGLVITLVLTAMLGNVTEPLEFSFLFIAPLLYAMYAVVLGFASVALALMGTAVGYIRGTIFDFAIFGVLYENSNWINIVIVGIVVAVVMYFLFTWFILKYDIKTPGREESPSLDNKLIKEKKYDEIAKLVIQGLGGKENILSVDNCITRLRIDLEEVKKVDRKILESSGCAGIFFPSSKHIHIVYGPLVEFVRNAIDEELKK